MADKQKKGPASNRSGSLRRFFEVFTESTWSLIKLNFFFLISCIPLFTIGPALTALAACICELIEGRQLEERPFHSYRTFFVSCFRKAIPWGILTIAANVILITALFYYGQQANENWFFVPPAALTLLALITLWGFLIHLFPLLPEKNMEKPSYPAVRTVLEHMGKTLAALLISTILISTQILLFPTTLPLIFTLGFSLPALVCGLAHTQGPENSFGV